MVEIDTCRAGGAVQNGMQADMGFCNALLVFNDNYTAEHTHNVLFFKKKNMIENFDMDGR